MAQHLKNTERVNYIDLGKLPPQSVELEEAIIGALMLESDSFLEVCDVLRVESFYKNEHGLIFKAITELFKENKPIDILTVTEQLRTNKNLEEIGGPFYLTQLTSRVGSAAHIEYHARIIQQKFTQRELIRISTDIQNKAFDESQDVAELLDFSETELFNITNSNSSNEAMSVSDIGKFELKELSENKDKLAGIMTGLPSVDKLCNGFQPNKLIILAARPAMGKTTLLTSMTVNQAVLYEKSVAIFSLEMGRGEIWKKLVADLTGITYAKLMTGDLMDYEWSELEKAQQQLENSNILIDDTPGLSVMELRAKCRRLKMKHDIDIVYIDYLQLMQGSRDKNSNREQEVSSISRGLKILAKEINVPIICLSQLNRLVESRPDKKPQLSDLRESGAIEQDADMVAFIHRPEYYGFMEYENNESTRNKVEILFRKNRGGINGDAIVNRTDNFTKIYEHQDIEPFDNDDLQTNNEF